VAGLLSEDLIREEIDGVKEALTRLPQEEQDKRYFRIKRVRAVASGLRLGHLHAVGQAMHLDGKDAVLPKDQWVTEATVQPSPPVFAVAIVDDCIARMSST
jgi:hypothetical protein